MNCFICRRWSLAATLLIAAGCATINPHERIRASIDLVEHATGRRPIWLAPWDEASPPWDGSSMLTVEDAVTLALRNNRDLRADVEMIGQANADLVQAGLLQNPRLNLMAMFPDGGGRSMLRSAGFPVQALQDLWLIPSRREVATAALQDVILRVADRAVETIAEVRRLYARLQYAQRAVELIKANLDVVEQSRRLIQTQQAAGKATLVEVNVPHIRYLRLQSERLTTEAEYRSLKRRLLRVMGLASATDAWSVAPLRELEETIEPAPSEAELLALASERRLDLQAAHWTLAAAEQRVQLARREAWPDVAVALSFERAPAPRSQNVGPGAVAGNAALGALQGASPSLQPIRPFGPEPREQDWMVGPMLDVELPIFDQNQAQIAKAYHEYRQRWAEYDARRQAIAAEVRESAVMYEQAHEQVRFFREAILPEVERNLEVVRESYRTGQDAVTILLQVQEDLLVTRLNTLAFVRDALLYRAELERQVGGRIEVGVESPSDASEGPNFESRTATPRPNED